MDISDFSLIIDEFDDGIVPNQAPTPMDNSMAKSKNLEDIDSMDSIVSQKSGKSITDNIQYHMENLGGQSPPVRRFTAEELIPQTMMRKAKKVK